MKRASSALAATPCRTTGALSADRALLSHPISASGLACILSCYTVPQSWR